MIFGVAIAFLFVIEGLRQTCSFILLIFQWKKSQKWHATVGKIVRSNLQSVLVPRGGKKSYNVDGSVRLITAYIPDILYEYRAYVQAFQSKQIYSGQNFPVPLNFANEFVEKYSEGKEVTVYYDPEKPEFAVLERARFKESFQYLARGAFFLIIGFTILIEVVKS
jgi:hypothetical protein